MGLLKPPKEPGLVTESRPTVLRRLVKFTRRRPKSKYQKEFERELSSGYRGFKKWFKETVELGD